MSERILIVDDESTARAALELLLRREGFDVRSATNGESALSECASFRPDLILLDILMPGMDGFEVCRRIKATPETRLTPVVLITGLSATEDRIKGINAGADDFLCKPIDINELLARSRSLLRLKQYTDELENAESVLFSLAHSIEARDPYTRGHCERLAEMSARLGSRLGIPEEHIKALRRAGIVHDIGKVVIPDAILLKPGPLSPEEVEIMQKHPTVGEKICAPLKTFRHVLPIIRHHHEKHDGTGYPDHRSPVQSFVHAGNCPGFDGRGSGEGMVGRGVARSVSRHDSRTTDGSGWRSDPQSRELIVWSVYGRHFYSPTIRSGPE
jgi:putative two-component system response regulator